MTKAKKAAGPIEWPQGGFDWDDEWRQRIPIVRGICLPSQVDFLAAYPRQPEFLGDEHGWHGPHFAHLAESMNRPWTLWDPATARAMTTDESLGRADPEFWLELCAQCSEINRDGHYGPLGSWVIHAGIARHGLRFMLGVGLDLVRARRLASLGTNDPVLRALRLSIVVAGEAEHDAVLQMLERIAGSTPEDRMLRAELCPHHSDWALQSLADDTPQDALFLYRSVVPVEDMRRYLAKKRDGRHWTELDAAIALQVHLHGEAAVDLLGDQLRQARPDAGEDAAKALLRMRSPHTVRILAELIDRPAARAALEKLARPYPAAVLKCAIEQVLASSSHQAEGWTVRLAMRQPAALEQALAALDEERRKRFQSILQSLQADEAAPQQLPPLLREPPWLRKEQAAELPTLDLIARPTPERVEWTAEEAAALAVYESPYYFRQERDAIDQVVENLHISPEGRARLAAGQALQAGDVAPRERDYYSRSVNNVLLVPDPVFSLALWLSYPTQEWAAGYGSDHGVLKAILARHGTAALPALLAYAQSSMTAVLHAVQQVDSAGVVPLALHALRNLKRAKAPAADWLRAHAATALAVALPMAFGKEQKPRDDAQHALRWLAAEGFGAQALEAAQAWGPQLAQALQALLDTDPLLVLPPRMPRLPTFCVAAAFRRPRLRDGHGTLPVAAAEHVASMLAISRLDAPYPGLAIVKEACDPASLADFTWDLFEAWLVAGAPSKESWAYIALGLLGNDDTARRLAPRIREWPGDALRQRAVTGLDLLEAIGTDAALMHLNGIAEKLKYKAVQERAKAKIAAIAEARGLSTIELADRLVPDLGLDEQGGLQLDFGARRFSVSFDETLKPYVRDAKGTRLKDLPKPLKSDDPALSEAAVERWKQLKKDAKAIATLQVDRLERAMVARRRWSGTDFRTFFLDHPLMRHLAARVVWGMYDTQGRVTGCLRVAEDWTLADGDDELAALADDAVVGVVHVLEMPQDTQAAFGQVFADYEILQPFKQLGRETYRLTPQEAAASEITRYAGKTVATGSVLGLANRGWQRGPGMDSGYVMWFSKDVGDGLQVDLEMDPGTHIIELGIEPRQRIPRLVLRKAGTWQGQDLQPFSRLDPIIASEVLRDADLLPPAKEAHP